MIRAVILLAWLAAACAPATRTIEGTVSAVGTDVEPRTAIAPADGSASIYLVGELEPELRRVSGATARVTGEPTAGAPGDALRVRDYRILEIDGDRPWVGVVRDGDEGPELAVEDGGPATLALVGLPAGALEPGAKAWVVGRREANVLRIRSYGELRPAPVD